MVRFLLIVALGASGGALLGSTRSCESGGCPLTATPLRGALYGACIAALLGMTLLRSPQGNAEKASASVSEHVLHADGEEAFARLVLASEVPVLVDFYADWCGPCRRLAPLLGGLAEELAGRARVVKVDVDKARELAGKYGVSSIPDVRAFRNGKQTGSLVGLQSRGAYLELLGDLPAEPAPAAIEPAQAETPEAGVGKP